jgi:peptidoglycan/LPS O-acetylase OafA/YrhL
MIKPIGQETRELRSLTSLRGLAAMAVVLQHFSATAQQYCRVWIPSLAPHGYIAVDFFFVLSGFIMSYTYLGTFQDRGMSAYGPFLAKRVARIVPLNIAVVVMLAAAAGASLFLAGSNIFFESNNFIFDFTANLLMLQGIGVGTNLNGPSWSISTEFAAYLAFPILVSLVFGRRSSLAVSTVVAAVVALCWLALLHPRLAMTSTGPPQSLIRCFTEFTLGMVAYRLYRQPIATVLGRDSVTILLSVAAVASLMARYDLPAVLLFPAIVVAYAVNDGRAARVMQNRLFYFLGVVSYSLYLIHSPFRPVAVLLLTAISPEPIGPAMALTFALLGSVAVVPLAWLAYVGIERPGRTLGRALFARRIVTPFQPHATS